ncbi:MAG TPA: DUF6572 domain-containing protein [Gemmataceae bacterium]|nr:DUF6572 domain-containing protein [Gemmataceae bacterium]
MMSDPNTIDIVVTDPETGKLLLVMTEDRPWKGAALQQQFLAKVNAYANYVLAPEFAQEQPGYTPNKVIIKLDCAHQPGKDALLVFDQARVELQKHGIDFEYEVCG